MSTLTAIVLSVLLIVGLLLEKLSQLLKNDITKFGRALGHVCEVVGEFLFVIIASIVLRDLIDRLL
ncbi:MAG: hypothetical protein OXT74_19120 [Candidatus Poribacteria bacterium]|nr:hypothetical protein [Candidatus Poribacteria bacterium]MDE0502810.1 hypothetical protein [Candidatus Poribacteria bacterium]